MQSEIIYGDIESIHWSTSYIFYNRTTHPRSKIETFHWYLPLHDFVDTVKKEPCMISTFTFYNKCKHVYEKKRAMVILDTYKNITYDMVIIDILLCFVQRLCLLIFNNWPFLFVMKDSTYAKITHIINNKHFYLLFSFATYLHTWHDLL